MSAKNKELLSDAMKRTTEWIFSQEIPSDITVHVGEASFSLHQFPLVSKCGYIRKLVSKSINSNLSSIEIQNIPGGAESFELAAKFCYGINFEITIQNIAMVRCVAEYLEMSEENHIGNLISRTEAYLGEVALNSLAGAVTILHSSQSLLPLAENLKIVNRCIDAIACVACKEGHNRKFSRPECHLIKPVLDWWAEDLMILRIDFFQRVIVAMMARGFKQYALSPLLMLYAQRSLHGFEDKGMEITEEQEKRVVLETILSFFPRDKNVIPVSFFSMMLRAAICLETTVACKLDLEKRIGLQLNDAVLDDLCFPSNSNVGSTVLDVDAVYRIMINFLENVTENKDSSVENEMDDVTRLMESYLAEIASDPNLSVSKFVDFSKLIPEQANINDDRLYRAVDIYLKVHPDLSETEKKTLCSVMNCQKLSREACAHAAQNDRLPVQMVIQVLYTEQTRLREDMELKESTLSPTLTSTVEDCSTIDVPSSLQQENDALKIELLKLKMKLKEIEGTKSTNDNKRQIGISSSLLATKIPHRVPRKSFIGSVSKRIGWFYPFAREGVMPPNVKGINYFRKDRRYSIS